MSKENTTNISTLHTFDTVHSADSVEWCPHEPNQNYFVCANYQLVETRQSAGNRPKRIGKIHLFSINPQKDLTQHQTIETAAILDQKWCHNRINNYSILGTVDSDHQLQIFRLIPDTSKLELITSYKGDDYCMLLSLDWSTGKYESDEPKILVSDSRGRIHFFNFKNNVLEKEFSVKGHDFEAWICAFYYWDTSIFFTGGDDSKLLKYDMRVGKIPVVTSRAHYAGVTCIHSNKEREYLVATGSYDQKLLLWDIRNMKMPSQNLDMPGPMWRLKWDPQTYNYLLAACMIGGFHIMDTSNELKSIVSYYDHKDLAYGSDWSYMKEDKVNEYGDCNRIIATCSFYDHKLCVAKVDLNK